MNDGIGGHSTVSVFKKPCGCQIKQLGHDTSFQLSFQKAVIREATFQLQPRIDAKFFDALMSLVEDTK